MAFGGGARVRHDRSSNRRHRQIRGTEPDLVWNGVSLWHIENDKYAATWIYRGRTRRQYRIKKKCHFCGADVYVTDSSSVRGNVSYCDRKCRHAVFRGKERKSKRSNNEGHILVYAPDHPNSRKKFVAEHRLVVEQDIGRYLRDDEVVHHIDCDPKNNAVGNLVVMSSRQHFLAHGSLNKCVKALIAGGCRLTFNREKLVYEVVYDSHRD